MKKIVFKFRGLGIDSEYQAFVKIFDINNCLLFSGVTYNGCISICLKSNTIYRLMAYSGSEFINKIIYIDSNHNSYVFCFNRSIFSRVFTFHLTDAFYKGLKIEKGEIILWQK